ncbi:MAG: cytochrome c oxidase subunit II [Pseudomonadota bacterium]
MGLMAALSVSAKTEEYPFPINLPVGVTEISRDVYGLHMLIFWICCVIAVGVFGVLFWSVIFHRKSKNPVPANFHESTTVEIIWTIIPFLILVAMAVPAAKVLVTMEQTGDADMTIKVTGYQWKWHYEYIGEDVGFFSVLNHEHNAARQTGSGIDVSQFPHYLKDVDKPLVVPVGQKIRFLHTSSDVIHSWWVQDLAVKKDAVPGFINENWARIDEPGTYRGKCAELCGRDHGFMPIVVEALPQEEFDAWLAAQKAGVEEDAMASAQHWETEELIARGEGVYNTNCIACHQAGGQGIPGAFPAITGSPIATGDASEHAALVINGVVGTAMAAYGQQLSDIELAAVVTYQRNALGNSVGDAIQPTDVAAIR